MIRICPMRDAECPHGMDCRFATAEWCLDGSERQGGEIAVSEIPEDIKRYYGSPYWAIPDGEYVLYSDHAAALLAERERATMVERDRCAIISERFWPEIMRAAWSKIEEARTAIRSGEEAGK